MRRSAVVVAVLIALAFVLVGGPGALTSPTTSELAPETDPDGDPEIVRPTGGESGFWPYLNSRRAFEQRSPINVVVIGETETVVRSLVEAGGTDWEETDPDRQEAGPATYSLDVDNASDTNESAVDDADDDGVRDDEEPSGTATPSGDDDGSVDVGATRITWTRTTGATRYAYVHPGDGGEGRWVEETAQIHDGTYYGHRYHIRMYESPNPGEPWVAMQTHHEHFDWFTLRHRVDGSQAAQMRLEADLMALQRVDVHQDVSRRYLGNGNSKDADGWATVVDLAGTLAAGLLLGVGTVAGAVGRTRRAVDERLTSADRRRLAAARARADPRHALLAVLIVGVVLGVRAGGIALESTGLLSMHAIAALLYPFVGLGLPVGTYLLARGLERRLDAAVVASGALAVAVWLDYGILGITTLPIDVIVQRMLVVVALGLLAGGATRRANRDAGWNELLLLGIGLWVLLLAATLFGYL